MGYIKRGIDLLTGDSSYADACRFAKDTMHSIAVTALIGASVGEIAVDGPNRHVLAVGLLTLSSVSEMGAWANKQNIKRAENSFTD